jgi:toluene monooxygenase system ferredoxin subunit
MTLLERKAIVMPLVFVCHANAVAEGGMGLFQVGRKSVLITWPKGGELKAYRGRCPHADMPLNEATFDGEKVMCPHHQWGFDASSGKCVTHMVRNALHPYELQVMGNEIHVDVGVVKVVQQAS